MKKISSIYFLLATLLLVACKGSSNSGQDPVTPTQPNLILTTDKLSIVADGQEKAMFLVRDENNEFYTKQATFTANGEILERAQFSTTTPGEYKIVAKVGDAVSNEIIITATKDETLDEPKDFNPTPRVLLEDWTGTWCQYCPRAHAILEDADKDPKFVTLEIHIGQGSDPFAVDALAKPLMASQSIKEYPTIRANRMYSSNTNFEGIKKMFADFTTQVGIAMDVKLKGNDVVAKVKVRRQPAFTSDVRLCIALYENNLHADQKNAVFPDKGNPIKNQRFDHVLRDFYQKAPLGMDIKFNDNIHIGEYTFTPESDWQKENLGVVVMVLDKKGRVLNSQYADVNSSKGY